MTSTSGYMKTCVVGKKQYRARKGRLGPGRWAEQQKPARPDEGSFLKFIPRANSDKPSEEERW